MVYPIKPLTQSTGKGDRDSRLSDAKLSKGLATFRHSFHTRMNVSKMTSAAGETTPETSRPMSRAFLKKLLPLLLCDSATVALSFVAS